METEHKILEKEERRLFADFKEGKLFKLQAINRVLEGAKRGERVKIVILDSHINHVPQEKRDTFSRSGYRLDQCSEMRVEQRTGFNSRIECMFRSLTLRLVEGISTR